MTVDTGSTQDHSPPSLNQRCREYHGDFCIRSPLPCIDRPLYRRVPSCGRNNFSGTQISRIGKWLALVSILALELSSLTGDLKPRRLSPIHDLLRAVCLALHRANASKQNTDSLHASYAAGGSQK